MGRSWAAAAAYRVGAYHAASRLACFKPKPFNTLNGGEESKNRCGLKILRFSIDMSIYLANGLG